MDDVFSSSGQGMPPMPVALPAAQPVAPHAPQGASGEPVASRPRGRPPRQPDADAEPVTVTQGRAAAHATVGHGSAKTLPHEFQPLPTTPPMSLPTLDVLDENEPVYTERGLGVEVDYEIATGWQKHVFKDEKAGTSRTVKYYVPRSVADKVVCYVNLGPCADRLTLDGISYFHGRAYTVPKALADVIQEQAQRTWVHEQEIGGANMNYYRRPLNQTLSQLSHPGSGGGGGKAI